MDSTTDQRLQERSYSDNNNPYAGEMGPAVHSINTGRQRFLGTHEVQGKEIKISRTEEGARGQASQDAVKEGRSH